jgi:hypothetical protein
MLNLFQHLGYGQFSEAKKVDSETRQPYGIAMEFSMTRSFHVLYLALEIRN